MTTFELLELIATELHFEIEYPQFRGGDFIIRRVSNHPSFKTEYASVRLDGDCIKFMGIKSSVAGHLADPNLFDKLVSALNAQGFLCNSLATMERPIANKMLLSYTSDK